MTDETQIQAPVMTVPGKDGWPPEPRVTQAETLLHGEHAEVIRLLGQAAGETSNAYALACKRLTEMFPSDEDENVYHDIVNATWELQERTVAVHREVAEKALSLTLRFQARRTDARADEKIGLAPG